MHIKKKDLSFAVLNKYAKAIRHDFSEEIGEIPPSIIEDQGHGYNNELITFEEMTNQRDEWREKYYALMERYIKCMEKEQKT